jgi:hypothetical protein
VTTDQLRDFLNERAVRYDEELIQHATQFRCSGGAVFSVYNSGRVVVGGKRTSLSAEVEALVGPVGEASAASGGPAADTPRRRSTAHGRTWCWSLAWSSPVSGDPVSPSCTSSRLNSPAILLVSSILPSRSGLRR